MSPAMRPVWLDTDPGFDDWLAMLMLAAHPGLRWLGISVVAGNAPLDVTLANALRMPCGPSTCCAVCKAPAKGAALPRWMGTLRP